MSTTAVTRAAGEAPATLTVTHYQQLAQRFMKALDEVSAIVPPIEGDADPAFVRTHLNASRAFLDTTIASVERHAELQNVQKLDVPDGRDTLQYIDAFRPILDHVLAFYTRLNRSLQTRQARLTANALAIYSVARTLSRDSRDPELSAAVASMKRDLGRRGPAPIPASVRRAAAQAAAAARASVIAAAMSSRPPEGQAS